MAKGKTPTTGATQQKRERWAWNPASREVLKSLREFVGTATPLPTGTESKYGYAVERILGFYKHWALRRSLKDVQDNSIQAKILKGWERTKHSLRIKKTFLEAQRSGRRASFDSILEASLITRGGQVCEDLNRAVLMRDFIDDPGVIEDVPEALELFVKAARDDRAKFLFDVATDMKNLDARVNKLKANELRAEIVRHWTDCHAPLWLMSRRAILKAAKALAGENVEKAGWNAESLKRVLRGTELVASDDRPIVDVEIAKGKIVGFKVQAEVYDQLPISTSAIQRGFLRIFFRPPGLREPTRYLIIREAKRARTTGYRVSGR